jgi:hypothetical protein
LVNQKFEVISGSTKAMKTSATGRRIIISALATATGFLAAARFVFAADVRFAPAAARLGLAATRFGFGLAFAARFGFARVARFDLVAMAISLGDLPECRPLNAPMPVTSSFFR